MRLTLPVLFFLAARAIFAVDGVVLISQSSVNSAGGFPYHIKSGSYRLSSSLIAPVNESVIVFDGANITLDLNGFGITCSFNEASPSYSGSCINDGRRSLSRIRISNGFINASGSSPTYNFYSAVGIDLLYSKATTIEDVHFGGSISNFDGNGMNGARNSIIRHNIFTDAASPNVACPSLVEGNVNETLGAGSSGSGCVYINNIGLF